MASSVPEDALASKGEKVARNVPTEINHALREAKIARIKRACESRNMPELAGLATSQHGLVNDAMRRTAWPLLLGCHEVPSVLEVSDWATLPKHRDENQVKLDVDRAFVNYPKDDSERQHIERKTELSLLITEVLRKYPFLCYFQGYHDIVQVFLLVLGPKDAREAIARLSLLRIRDFMLPDLDPAIAHLDLLPAILAKADPDVAQHVFGTRPFFALSAILTLYAHDIEEYGDIARLFDFFIAHEAVTSLYLCATIVVSRRAQLLEIEPDDLDVMHSILCKLPMPLELDKWIADALDLCRIHPPESLSSRNWRWISSSSILKTTRDPVSLSRQTLADGEKMFHAQEREMRRVKLLRNMRLSLWVYRRRYGALSIAVLVAVASYWLRRDTAAIMPYWQRLSHTSRGFWS